MRISKYIPLLLTCLLCAFSCTGLNDEVQFGDSQVRLQAVLGSSFNVSSSFSKTSGPLDSSYPDTLTLGLAKTTNSPDFHDAGNEILRAVMQPGTDGNINIRDIEFDEYQSFLSNNDRLRYASWYPYQGSVLSKDSNTSKVSIPVDGKTDVLYGSIASGTQSSGFNTIVFNHALSKFTFKVYAMVETDQLGQALHDPNTTWGALKDLKVKAYSNEVVLSLPKDEEGVYGFNYNYLTESDELSMKELLGLGADFITDWSNYQSFEKAFTLGEMIIAPPKDEELIVSVLTQKSEEIEQSLSIIGNFEKGKNYDVYLRFSDTGLINAELKVSDWQEYGNIVYSDAVNSKVYYDLSSLETANSYVISSANRSYCFDVSIKGNGYEGVIGNIPSIDIEPDSLGFVWMDESLYGKLTLDYDYPVRGRAMITLTGRNDGSNILDNEGNALVAAFKKNPQTGKSDVLWCWHLWITDVPQDQSYNNGFLVMDRDLGAIEYSSLSYSEFKDVMKVDGLYYQWGRPTPFAFGNTIYFEPKDYPSEDEPVYYNSKLEAKDDGGRAFDRSEKPMTYYTNRIVTAYKENLWGWRSDYQEYIKSIYDPCPPGYRVPSSRVWRNLVMDSEAELVDDFDHTISFTVDSYYDVNYPISGYWYHDGEQFVNKGYWATYSADTRMDNPGAYMWTATYNMEHDNGNGTYGIPYALDYTLNEGQTSVGVMDVTEGYAGTNAMPVRCVARRSRMNVKDLSDSQTANCYIVSEPGYYKFKANVLGNGVGQLVSLTSTTVDISEGMEQSYADRIAKLDFLWWQGDLSGDNDFPTEKNFRFLDGGVLDDEGYVTFHIEEFVKGNMILAGLDARGSILWSWHIWMTDSPELKRSNDFAVMDRALGATSAPALSSTTLPAGYDVLSSIGLYYQWGRKDPFPGPENLSANSTSTFSKWFKYTDGSWSSSPSQSLDSYTAENSEKTVSSSAANPMRFHSSASRVFNSGIPSSSNQGDYRITDAMNEASNQCFTTFQDERARTSLWGYSSYSAGVGRTTTKTMYDPCPPGYCVAFYSIWTNANPKNYAYYYSWLDWYCSTHTTTSDGNKEYTEGQKGIVLNKSRFATDRFDYTWFPFGGYLDSYIDSGTASFNQLGEAGHIHTSTPGGNGSRSLFYTKSVTGQIIDSGYRGLPSSYAYPVRCQKE